MPTTGTFELTNVSITGTGTIANFVAGQAKKVIGLEYVADAIAHLVQNGVAPVVATSK